MVEWRRTNLTGAGDPAQVIVVRASGTVFDVLQTPVALGRALTPAEAEAFFRKDVQSYVDRLPWLWRRVAWVFARQLLRDPAGAAQRIPVFELTPDQEAATA